MMDTISAVVEPVLKAINDPESGILALSNNITACFTGIVGTKMSGELLGDKLAVVNEFANELDGMRTKINKVLQDLEAKEPESDLAHKKRKIVRLLLLSHLDDIEEVMVGVTGIRMCLVELQRAQKAGQPVES